MFSRLRNLIAPPVVEQRAALLAGKQITYTLKRSSKRRSIGLRIDDRGLTVSMPLRASEKWLHSVLQDRARWVVEKLDGWQLRQPARADWSEGASIAYLGEPIVLRLERNLFDFSALRHGQTLRVFIRHEQDESAIENAVTAWYKTQALALFQERIRHFAPLMNVAPRIVKLSNAKTQWGCCTARGTIRLNLQLIKLPLAVIDYVVVHELAHLRQMNHSAAFWAVVETHCPNYVKLRQELKKVSLTKN